MRQSMRRRGILVKGESSPNLLERRMLRKTKPFNFKAFWKSLYPGKKQRRPFAFGGSIFISGPDILERLGRGEKITMDEQNKHIEFYLEAKNGPDEKFIEINPWVDLSEADIKIRSNIELNDIFRNHIAIDFLNLENREFSLSLSAKQAKALTKILTDYVMAYEAINGLTKDISV